MTTCCICGITLTLALLTGYHHMCATCAKQMFVRDAYYSDKSETKWIEMSSQRPEGWWFGEGHGSFDSSIQAIKSEYGACSQCGFCHWIPTIQLGKQNNAV